MLQMVNHQPRHPDRQGRLVPRGGTQFAQFLETRAGDVDVDSKRDAAQHGARGNPHGRPVGIIDGQCVGDLAGSLPGEVGGRDVAIGRPRGGAHLPAVSGVRFTGGLEVFGDQRGVLVRRFRNPGFDHRGEPPVHLGAS